MPAELPDSTRVGVAPALARELLDAAQRLPAYDNREFYSTELQAHVLESVREAVPEAFDSLVSQIKSRLTRWPYCALVNGLSFDEGNKVFVAINRAFGELVARPYEKPRAQLVHYIQPATDLPSARGGHESERLHTDTADWKEPVELISMVCVRADPSGGGRSRVLDVDTIRSEVKVRLGNATLERLETEAVPWQLAPYFGGGVHWRTVLTESSICWRRYTIDMALDSTGATLSPETLSALEAFENLLSATPATLDFLMREGELLFSDNRRTIHARTPLANGRSFRSSDDSQLDTNGVKMQFAQICDRVETEPIANRDIDRSAFTGNWVNSNPDTNSIARIKVFEKNGELQLQVSAIGPDGLIDWGPVRAEVFASGPASRTGAGFACRYDFGFAEARMQGMIMKGLLVLAQFHIFKDDSKRASYFLREYYAKTHESFN